jgi:hypothetical protein
MGARADLRSPDAHAAAPVRAAAREEDLSVLTFDDIVTDLRAACAEFADLDALIATAPAMAAPVETLERWCAHLHRHLIAATPLAGVPDPERWEVARTLTASAVAFQLMMHGLARRGLLTREGGLAAFDAYHELLDGIAADVARVAAPAPVA